MKWHSKPIWPLQSDIFQSETHYSTRENWRPRLNLIHWDLIRLWKLALYGWLYNNWTPKSAYYSDLWRIMWHWRLEKFSFDHRNKWHLTIYSHRKHLIKIVIICQIFCYIFLPWWDAFKKIEKNLNYFILLNVSVFWMGKTFTKNALIN